MTTYSAAYPALPQLNSDAPDSPAAAIAAGAPLNDADLTAAWRQTKRRRDLFSDNPRRATEQEMQAAVKRELRIQAEHTAVAGQPVWATNLLNQVNAFQNQMTTQMTDFQNQMAAQMTDLQNQQNQMTTQQNQMTDQLTNLQTQQNQMTTQMADFQTQQNQMKTQMTDIQSKLSNAAAWQPEHPIHRIHNEQGNLPDEFPTTLGALDSLSHGELGQLLTFYGLPASHELSNRRFCLKFHLGIRPSVDVDVDVNVTRT